MTWGVLKSTTSLLCQREADAEHAENRPAVINSSTKWCVLVWNHYLSHKTLVQFPPLFYHANQLLNVLNSNVDLNKPFSQHVHAHVRVTESAAWTVLWSERLDVNVKAASFVTMCLLWMLAINLGCKLEDSVQCGFMFNQKHDLLLHNGCIWAYFVR